MNQKSFCDINYILQFIYTIVFFLSLNLIITMNTIESSLLQIKKTLICLWISSFSLRYFWWMHHETNPYFGFVFGCIPKSFLWETTVEFCIIFIIFRHIYLTIHKNNFLYNIIIYFRENINWFLKSLFGVTLQIMWIINMLWISILW